MNVGSVPDAAVGAFVDVVIRTTSVRDTAAFLGLFDFAEVGRVEIPDDVAAARFGLDSIDGPAVRFANVQHTALGRSGASILAVPTSRLGSPRSGWEHGPRAVDIYTTDLDASLERAVAAGFDVSPVGALSAGPMSMR